MNGDATQSGDSRTEWAAVLNAINTVERVFDLEADARQFIEESNAIMPHAFFLARREVGPWKPVHNGGTDG